MPLIDIKSIRQRMGKAIGGFGQITGEDSFLYKWMMPGKYSPQQFLEQYQGYVYTCVSAIAQATATAEFFVAKNDLNQSEPVAQPNHEVMGMLNNPNPDMSRFQFLEITQTHIDLAGEAFWYIAKGELSGQPKELYILRPDLMYINVDKQTGLILGYIMRKPDLTEIKFEKDEIIHFKTPNPLNNYRGMGVIEASLAYVQTEDYATQYTRNSIYNNALPSGIISVPTNDKTEFEQFKRKWKEEYGTLERANKLAFIRGTDVKFQQIGAGLDNTALVALKNMTRDDIMAMFRVSKPMIGIVDDVNLANGENAKRLFAEYVVKPRIMRQSDTLNNQLMRRYGMMKNGMPTYTIEYKNPVPENVKETIASLSSAVDVFLTVNEARALQSQWDLPELVGGSVLRRPVNLVEVAAENADELADEGEDDAADEASENETQTTQTEETTTTPPAAPTKSAKKKDELTQQQKENYRRELYLHASVWQKHYVNAVTKVFDKLEKQSLSHIKMAKVKEWDASLPEEDQVVQMMQDSTYPIALDIMAQQGDDAMQLIGATQSYEVTDQAKKAIRARIDKWAGDLAVNLKDSIATAITDTASNGGSIQDIKDAISMAYDQFSGVSTERIARTETSKYANLGATDAYKQSGLVTGKEWFVNPGACDFCRSLEGKVVDLDSNYADLGSTITGADGTTYTLDFEDVGEPPLHPNCECTLLPVAIEV